jgi:DNA-directed RNA polymerase subunit M/transcription elongation factor TFIIS
MFPATFTKNSDRELLRNRARFVYHPAVDAQAAESMQFCHDSPLSLLAERQGSTQNKAVILRRLVCPIVHRKESSLRWNNDVGRRLGFMGTSVSSWPCKCGNTVKVISEVDRAQPSETKEVACPKCGNKQIVYAHIIISVTVQKASVQG